MSDRRDEFKESVAAVLEQAGAGQTNLASANARSRLTNSIMDLVDPLYDEIESVWCMLDKMKASDIENYEEALEKASQMRAIERLMLKMKPGQA